MNTTPPTSDSPAIDAVGVTKRFGSLKAVDDVDLRVDRGEIVALLGPNGAGKTTFLDMVLGFTSPDAGTLTTLGRPPARAASSGLVGAVLQSGGLLNDLSVRETLSMIAACHQRPAPVEEVLERAALTSIARRKVSKLSGGEKQRLRFGLALLTDPPLLLLDEPTAAMDVGARAEFWATMRGEAERGRTVIFATHYLQEATDFADRIILMRAGTVAHDGTMEQLGAGRARTLTCRWASEEDPGSVAERANASVTGSNPGHVTFAAQDTDSLARLLLVEGLATDLEIHSATLDEIFQDLTMPETAAPIGGR